MERGLGPLGRRHRRGATAIEYAMVSFLVGATLLVTIRALGVSVSDVYTTVDQEVSDATGS